MLHKLTQRRRANDRSQIGHSWEPVFAKSKGEGDDFETWVMIAEKVRPTAEASRLLRFSVLFALDCTAVRVSGLRL